MKILFKGKAECEDKPSISCSKIIDITEKEIRFTSYPLSLLNVNINDNVITIDGEKYEFKSLPITIYRKGKHITKYRELIEEKITIDIEISDDKTEV